jgi:MFS family permease
MNKENLSETDLKNIKKELNPSRFRLGMANLFFAGEESALAALKVMIIRMLGGNDVHIGFIASFGPIVAFTQWLGVKFLKVFKSNRKAMAIALCLGVASAIFLALSAGMNEIFTGWKIFLLWVFLSGSLVMAIATGIQLTIETNWIGDLVPEHIRGWFVSVKTSISIVCMVILALLFGFIVDNSKSLSLASFWLYIVIALSHVLAILLILKIPDRTPQSINFFAKKKSERVNYYSFPLWCYISFYILWTGGRSIFFAFITIFLIEEFNMGMLQLSGLGVINSLISVGALMILGKISDKLGNRKPLMFMSAIVALSMFLWPLSAWLGVSAIIVSYVVNGLAGATHTMVLNNYGLEIFPTKGRASYFALGRIIVGAITILLVNCSAFFLHYLESINWKWDVAGVELTRYHLIFIIGGSISFFSFVPLWIVGNRKVQSSDEEVSKADTLKAI